MADNTEQVPAGSAPQSAGSGATPAPSQAGDKDISEQRLKDLESKLLETRKYADNLRALHDRQMNEIRQQLQSPRSNGQEGSMPTPTFAQPTMNADMDAERQERAVIRFRQENPDWPDYWPKITEITSDPTKAAPYVYYKPDGTIDYFRSLKAVREDLELTELRARKAELDKAQEEQESQRAALLRDATISGSSATSPQEIEWGKLSTNEKTRKLVELGLVDYDPEDPPESMRKR